MSHNTQTTTLELGQIAALGRKTWRFGLVRAALWTLGVNLLIVTPDERLDENLMSEIRATVVSDPEKKWAGWLGLLHDGPVHGTYLLDRQGKIVWGENSETPYMDIKSLVKRIWDFEG